MNVKKTKKFKENRPESYHVHDRNRQSINRLLRHSQDKVLVAIVPPWLSGNVPRQKTWHERSSPSE